MNLTLPERPAAMAGLAVALTGADSPLGAAVARRLAAESATFVLGLDPSRPSGRAVLAEVRRIRALRRRSHDPLVVHADPTTEAGAAEFVAEALAGCGRLDALVHLVEPCAGRGATAPDGGVMGRLLPLVRRAADALRRGGGSRLLVGVDVSECRGAATRGDVAARLEDVVHAAARALDGVVTVNGVLVDAPRPAADRALALAAGPPPADVAPRAPLHAAAGVVSRLVGESGGAPSGHVLRLGPTAALPQAPSELVALFARPILA